MNQRNEAFFAAHTKRFLATMEQDGDKAALREMRSVLSEGLKAAYGTDFKKGNPNEFVRLVGERDESVGLSVEFPEVSERRLVYRLLDDPFPGLKGHVAPEKLDATYMEFKVNHILGEGWSWRTAKHLWKGDSCTEHVIEKR